MRRDALIVATTLFIVIVGISGHARGNDSQTARFPPAVTSKGHPSTRLSLLY